MRALVAVEGLLLGVLAAVLLRRGTEVEPTLAAGMISTVPLLLALWVARGARPHVEAGRIMALAGHVAFAALLNFSFLCARAVELLYHLGPDPSWDAAPLQDPFFGLSVAHGGLTALAMGLYAVALLRAARRAPRDRSDGLLAFGILHQHLVTVSWLFLLLFLYLLR